MLAGYEATNSQLSFAADAAIIYDHGIRVVEI